jgi:hypothetical protein
MRRDGRRRLRVIIENDRPFAPPPGTEVVSGTIFSHATELVLRVLDDSVEIEAAPVEEAVGQSAGSC